MRHVVLAIGILVLSGAAAGLSNSLRGRPLPWVREELGGQQPVSSQPTSQASSQPAPQDKPGIIKIDAVLEHLQMQDAVFVDAREAHETNESGHFKGAYLIPSSDIYKSIEKLNFMAMVPPESLVIVYCGGGDCEASHNVRDALRRDFNYTNVVVYEKGWAEVMQSGRFAEYIEQGATP